MAWMFLAMDSPAATFIGRATTAGHSNQTTLAAFGLFVALALVLPLRLRPARV
jgi:hypothetical protein